MNARIVYTHTCMHIHTLMKFTHAYVHLYIHKRTHTYIHTYRPRSSTSSAPSRHEHVFLVPNDVYDKHVHDKIACIYTYICVYVFFTSNDVFDEHVHDKIACIYIHTLVCVHMWTFLVRKSFRGGNEILEKNGTTCSLQSESFYWSNKKKKKGLILVEICKSYAVCGTFGCAHPLNT